MSKPSKGASWLSAFRVAFPRTLPVLAGYLALGAAFGLMLSSIGLSPLWALFMSIVIYAGSGQFLAVTLIASQTSLPQVALLTFLLNFRHFFYGLSMISRYKDAGARKGYLIFAMTDETYALLAGGVPPARVDATDYYFAVSLLDHLYWIGGSLIGAAAGNLITFDTTGVDFAMTALFVVLAVEQWKSNSRHAPALFGLCFGIASLLIFGADLFLIPALVAIAAALLLPVLLRLAFLYADWRLSAAVRRTGRRRFLPPARDSGARMQMVRRGNGRCAERSTGSVYNPVPHRLLRAARLRCTRSRPFRRFSFSGSGSGPGCGRPGR